MKKNFMPVLRGLLFTGLFWVVSPHVLPQAPQISKETAATGIVTLYTRDPLAQSFCFRDGGFGSMFQENEVRNRCSDINFNGYRQKDDADIFKIAVEGARRGVILNLGTTDELQKKYTYQETIGKGQGFASIHVKNGKVYILQDRRERTYQELTDSPMLFQEPSNDTETVNVRLGHVYLMRLTDGNEKGFELMVKLLVIAHAPGESVTIRWQVL